MYLGGNEQSTYKYVSELLGKETIDSNSYGKSTGRGGSYSKNWQILGRELLTADEVRMLDNKYALLFIRGERPMKDLKYDIKTHPDISLTADGKGEKFVHGKDTLSVGSVGITDNYGITLQELNISDTDYELLSEEDMEALFYEEEL